MASENAFFGWKLMPTRKLKFYGDGDGDVTRGWKGRNITRNLQFFERWCLEGKNPQVSISTS